MMKKTCGILAIVILAATACRTAGPTAGPAREVATGTLGKVLREKRLRVAYIQYPPTAFRDSATGQVRGHFVDALQEIINQLQPGTAIEYEETNWADFTTALESD